MNGFSDRDVEVGHLYGLRWFQLTTTEHRIVSASGTIGGGTTCECSCGGKYDSNLSLDDAWEFMRRHKDQGQVGLSGVQAQWQPGENVASCLTHHFSEHRAPTRSCLCGYWAYWKLGQQPTRPPHVVGIIKGYGNVIQGDLGFRCSHAKVVALYLPGWDDAAALALEADWAPVYWSLGAMLLRHPAPEGQPKLADDFYIRQVRENWEAIPGHQPAFTDPARINWGGGTGGWDRTRESALDYARRLGLAGPLRPCMRCGLEDACATGVHFCGPCKLLEARSAQLASMSGQDALRHAHERRESWASGSTWTVYGGGGGGGNGQPTYFGGPVSGGGNSSPHTIPGGAGGSSTVSGTGYARLTQAEIDLIKKMILKSGGQYEA